MLPAGVEYAEPNYLVQLLEAPAKLEPDDPLLPEQYYLPRIAAPEAWAQRQNASAIKVCIIGECGGSAASGVSAGAHAHMPLASAHVNYTAWLLQTLGWTPPTPTLCPTLRRRAIMGPKGLLAPWTSWATALQWLALWGQQVWCSCCWSLHRL